MNPFPFVVGDLVKLEAWPDERAMRITAIGEIRFLAIALDEGERAYLISAAWLKVEPVKPLPDSWFSVLANGFTGNSYAKSAEEAVARARNSQGKEVVAVIHIGTDENGEDFALIERVPS